MRIPKWILVGLLLTGGTQQVCGDFRSHLSSPAVVLPEANNGVASPAVASTSTSTSVSSLLSNLVSSITTQDAATQSQSQPQQQQGKRGKRNGKGKGKGKAKGKGNKGASVTSAASPGVKLFLKVGDDSSSSSSSSENTGPVDNLLNEDADILAAQENLSVGAMSSDGLDKPHITSSSSDDDPPAKIPTLASRLLTQAQQKQAAPSQTQTQTQTSTQPIQETTTAPTPAPVNEDTETDTETDTDTDADTEIEADVEPEEAPQVMSRTISMSPFVRLTITTGRDSRFSPRVLGFGSDPLQQVWAELRASLRQHDPIMSMWRQSLSQHGSSQVMRVFPIGEAARVSVIHIHDEPTISQHPCRADAQRLCASEMSSHNMLDAMACLGRHDASVSEQCAHEMAHCPAMACAQDVQQLCAPQERVSRSSVMECLVRHHHQLSQRCQSAAGINTTPAETNAAAATPTSTEGGAITPLSAFSISSSDPSSSSSSSSSNPSPSVSASFVVGLTILALLLLSLSAGLYAHLRRITREPEHIKLEHVNEEEEDMQHA